MPVHILRDHTASQKFSHALDAHGLEHVCYDVAKAVALPHGSLSTICNSRSIALITSSNALRCLPSDDLSCLSRLPCVLVVGVHSYEKAKALKLDNAEYAGNSADDLCQYISKNISSDSHLVHIRGSKTKLNHAHLQSRGYAITNCFVYDYVLKAEAQEDMYRIPFNKENQLILIYSRIVGGAILSFLRQEKIRPQCHFWVGSQDIARLFKPFDTKNEVINLWDYDAVVLMMKKFLGDHRA